MAETNPVYEQALCYTAEDLRRMSGGTVCGEGIVFNGGAGGTDPPANALYVYTGGSGLDIFVAPGAAWIKGEDDAPDQGYYFVYNDDVVTLTMGANASGLPRIDTIVATVHDSQYAGSADDWEITTVVGTPTAGAQITAPTVANYLAGVGAVPTNSLVLGYVRTPSGFAGPYVNGPAGNIAVVRQEYIRCGREAYISLEASAVTNVPASGVGATVALATTVYNDSDYFSVASSVVTILKTGIYDISGMVEITTDAPTIEVGVSQNGLWTAGVIVCEQAQTNRSAAVGDTRGGGSFSRHSYPLSAGDTVRLYAWQNDASAHDTRDTGSFHSYLTVRRVGNRVVA